MDEVREHGKQGRWVWMMSGNYLWEAAWMRSGNVGQSVGGCG